MGGVYATETRSRMKGRRHGIGERVGEGARENAKEKPKKGGGKKKWGVGQSKHIAERPYAPSDAYHGGGKSDQKKWRL